MREKTLFIYTGNNPVHGGFANLVAKKSAPFSSRIPRNFDIYFSEGIYAQPLFMKKRGKFKRNAKLIVLFADPRLFYLNTRKRFNFKKEKIEKMPRWKEVMGKTAMKKLDGAICVGKFEQELFKKINKKSPSKVVYGFISKERYAKLRKFKPTLKTHNLLFIGGGPDYYCKGLDFLIETFEELKKDVPDSKLYVVGKWEPKEEWRKKDIHFVGEKKDLTPYLKGCSLYVHFGRGDAFPVATLEMMAAGIPVMVSEYTGTKEFVKKVDKNMVVPFNKRVVSKQIKDYFNSSLKTKQKLSKKFKEIAKQFGEKDMHKLFKKRFLELIKEINSKKK